MKPPGTRQPHGDRDESPASLDVTRINRPRFSTIRNADRIVVIDRGQVRKKAAATPL